MDFSPFLYFPKDYGKNLESMKEESDAYDRGGGGQKINKSVVSLQHLALPAPLLQSLCSSLFVCMIHDVQRK